MIWEKFPEYFYIQECHSRKGVYYLLFIYVQSSMLCLSMSYLKYLFRCHPSTTSALHVSFHNVSKHTLSGDKVKKRVQTFYKHQHIAQNFPNPVMCSIWFFSFLRQPIRFKETFQQPMRIKQPVGILAITGSKNKHTIGSGRDWSKCWCR